MTDTPAQRPAGDAPDAAEVHEGDAVTMTVYPAVAGLLASAARTARMKVLRPPAPAAGTATASASTPVAHHAASSGLA